MRKIRKGSVAAYLKRHIEASPKTQNEIARELGFAKASLISAFKSGASKFPVTHTIKMAEILDVAPMDLFRLCMGEYAPDVLELYDQVYDRESLSKGEAEFLKHLRSHTQGKDFDLDRNARGKIDALAKQLT